MKTLFFSLLASIFLLTSCTKTDLRVTRPISHESLTRSTTEKVNFSFKATNFEKDLESWMQKDIPDRAEVSCDKDKAACNKAASIFKKMGIYFVEKNQAELKDDIVIYYDAEQKIDCSKIIEGRSNFGCATSSNIGNMIRAD
jgi:hypothetical protein